MSSPDPAAMLLGTLILIVNVELLRRRSLREKYAALWLAVSTATVIIGVFPSVLRWLADFLGFAVPANLLFFAGGIVLTVISMQLSLETGRLGDQSQRLAEELALLRLEVTQLRQAQQDEQHSKHPN
jgi:hypothetical protein